MQIMSYFSLLNKHPNIFMAFYYLFIIVRITKIIHILQILYYFFQESIKHYFSRTYITYFSGVTRILFLLLRQWRGLMEIRGSCPKPYAAALVFYGVIQKCKHIARLMPRHLLPLGPFPYFYIYDFIRAYTVRILQFFKKAYLLAVFFTTTFKKHFYIVIKFCYVYGLFLCMLLLHVLHCKSVLTNANTPRGTGLLSARYILHAAVTKLYRHNLPYFCNIILRFGRGYVNTYGFSQYAFAENIITVIFIIFIGRYYIKGIYARNNSRKSYMHISSSAIIRTHITTRGALYIASIITNTTVFATLTHIYVFKLLQKMCLHICTKIGTIINIQRCLKNFLVD
ncbi:pD339L [African swine fever virus]|uniref:PD339L n=1 Tax=African swine fever virus TaxID=10497 RepID=A0A894KSQ1_ASF|nr:pD339L [African swine fever virus]